jgi:phosphatidylserine/phosphatidylglycerophosphate/cardiolipin synthase-like enzyme
LGSASGRVDAFAGDAIEAVVRASTDGVSTVSAGTGRWILRLMAFGRRATPPPLAGCRLDVLIDGAEAFAALVDAIQQARESVCLPGVSRRSRRLLGPPVGLVDDG